MVQFTGRREPILISGAGKVVDGILRQRPCFLFPTISTFLFGIPPPLVTCLRSGIADQCACLRTGKFQGED
jgi:hypothetical protein